MEPEQPPSRWLFVRVHLHRLFDLLVAEPIGTLIEFFQWCRASIAELPNVLRFLVWLALFPIFLPGLLWFRFVWPFLVWWRDLVPALPALGAGLGIVYLASCVHFSSHQQLVLRYERAGRDAVSRKDPEIAVVCHERLIQLAGDRDEDRYELARALDQVGQSDRAVATMRNLASPKSGHPRAHLWLARRALQQARVGPKERTRARLHLVTAITAMPDNLECHALLGLIYLAEENVADAEGHLGRAVDAYPGLALVLARISSARGEQDAMRAHARRARELFGERLAKNRADATARLAIGESAILLGDFAGAVEMLGDRPEPGSPRAHTLSRAYVAWFESARAGERRADDPLSLLELAIRSDPDNVQAIHCLLSEAEGTGPWAEQARKLLEVLLSNHGVPATVHLVIANQAYKRGDASAARRHLEEAHRLDPDRPLIANNLAWILSETPPRDLARALRVIDRVVARHPDVPTYRDTRGRILLEMGHRHEALAELERVLASRPADPRLHTLLAELYEPLGMTDLAHEHRALAMQQAPQYDPAIRIETLEAIVSPLLSALKFGDPLPVIMTSTADEPESGVPATSAAQMPTGHDSGTPKADGKRQ